MKRIAIQLCAASATLCFVSGLLNAETIKFCIDTSADYADNGIAGEDHWTTDAPADFRGGRAIVMRSGIQIFSGNLGDGLGSVAGCTPTLTVATANASYSLQIFSTNGSVAGHDIDVRYKYTDGNLYGSAVVYNFTVSLGEGTYDVDVVGSSDTVRRVFRTCTAASQTAFRAGQWAAASTLDIVWDTLATKSSYSSGNDRVTLSNAGTANKFIIAHEVGHKYTFDYAGGYLPNNCSIEDSSCPGTDTAHAMWSKEYQSCGFTEGLAHYVAAVTWNNYTGQTDCKFRYYKNKTGFTDQNVDCEDYTSTYPTAFMETVCTGTSHTNRGNELDWLRLFWDVLTATATQPAVTFLSTMDWLEIGGNLCSWPQLPYCSIYSNMDTAANAVGGAINAKWDGFKGFNGIDH